MRNQCSAFSFNTISTTANVQNIVNQVKLKLDAKWHLCLFGRKHLD